MTELINKPWFVVKFGGSSVSSLKDWNNIVSIVSQHLSNGYKVAVVHSAFKDVTNQLEQLAKLAVNQSIDEPLNQLLNRHRAMAHELEVDARLLDKWFDNLTQTLANIASKDSLSACDRAEVVAHGELLSSTLGAAFLKKQFTDKYSIEWIDAREVLTSNDDAPKNISECFLNAVCHPRPDSELVNHWSQYDIILSQGFIARNQNGQTVLLGREGSDTSAAYFAAITQAEKLQVWTDVAGMYSTDPNKVAEAKKITHISYNEAFDMAEAGAKVLHPRCLSAVMPYQIPVEIRSTHNPDESGTTIDGHYEESKWVKAIALKQQIPVITLLLGRRGQQPDTLQKVFATINQFGLSSELLASTKESLVMAIETNNSLYSGDILNELSAQLAEVCRSVLVSSSSMITLIGCQASQALWHLMQIDESHMPEQWLLMSHTSSDHHLSMLISDDEGLNILNVLHRNLIK
ncbi:MAG: aspartate kinase [Kangiellaceae bacterium]|nr:aspartate kinase [Kangiellaceae bacterium]